jgi:hypothetical protein
MVEFLILTAEKSGARPEIFSLEQNHPNPFNPTTEIRFSIPSTSRVSLDVFNVTGQRIVTLVDEILAAGQHSVVWDGRDTDGNSVSSGIYFYRIVSGEFAATRKMVLLK